MRPLLGDEATGQEDGQGAGRALSGWSPQTRGEYTDDQDPVKAIAAEETSVKLVTIEVCRRRRFPRARAGLSRVPIGRQRSRPPAIVSRFNPVPSGHSSGPGPAVQMNVSGPNESGPIPDAGTRLT